MANAIYPKAKEKFLSASINMSSDTIKLALVDTADYTYSASHEFYSDISAGVPTNGTITVGTNKSVTSGVFDADDVTFVGIGTDSAHEALVLYKDTGSAGTSPLIAYIDVVTSGLPVTPNGGNISVAFDSGANKIFAL